MGLGSVGIFVQVRLGSQRLPRKALLPLGGSTLIEQVMAALAAVDCDTRALLTDAESSPALAAPAGRAGFEVFVGPGEDVLARYALATEHYGVSTVVRATGDNPLVSASLTRSILVEHQGSGADLSHFLGCPLGTGVEVLRSTAVHDANRRAAMSREREHISTWLYRHPESYRIHEPLAGPESTFRDAHVSVDTVEDYERMKRIYADLYRGEPIEVESVVAWLKANPDQIALMRIAY